MQRRESVSGTDERSAALPKGRSPSFEGLRAASVLASAIKKANRSSGTRHETELGRQLWHHGLRYRKNEKRLPGRPDFAFWSARIAVFCDGDFWHGKDWDERQRKLRGGSNAEYWIAKIARNRARDREVDAALRSLGWQVIRVWESDIYRSAIDIAAAISVIVNGNRAERAARANVLRVG